MLALAINVAPAAAQAGDSVQQAADSTGAAQVGALQADAPIRVLSDGDDAGSAGVAAGPQSSGDSTGAAQAGPADVDAPVRVLSDGDNAGSAATGAAAGDQATGESTGGAQLGGGSVTAPIRIASDGDDVAQAAAVPDPGTRTAPVDTPDTGTGDPGDDSGSGTNLAPDTSPNVVPAVGTAPDDDGGVLPSNANSDAGLLDVADESALPLTGAAVGSLLLTGLALLLAGSAFRCTTA
jgi:hypothetical protein